MRKIRITELITTSGQGSIHRAQASKPMLRQLLPNTMLRAKSWPVKCLTKMQRQRKSKSTWSPTTSFWINWVFYSIMTQWLVQPSSSSPMTTSSDYRKHKTLVTSPTRKRSWELSRPMLASASKMALRGSRDALVSRMPRSSTALSVTTQTRTLLLLSITQGPRSTKDSSESYCPARTIEPRFSITRTRHFTTSTQTFSSKSILTTREELCLTLKWWFRLLKSSLIR